MTTMTKSATRIEVLDWLCDVGRPLVLTEFGINSCVVSTWLAIATLREYGHLAQPMAVGVVAGTQDFDTFDGTEGYAVAIKPEDHQGHVVAWMPEHRLLVDISADQLSRPEKGLLVPALWLKMPKGWGRGDHTAWFDGETEPIRIAYEAWPESPAWWEESPNWGGRDTELQLRDRVLTKARKDLGR